jgi:uncharacterized SAM-binding protein YcdF (DUF218 family)
MEADHYAEILWNFQKLNQPLERCDAIVVPGSHDDMPAEYAIELFKRGYGKFIIFSGGALQSDPISGEKREHTEAEGYARLAYEAGIDPDKVFIENRSTNTGENLRFSMELIKENNLDVRKILFIQKPYMERRLAAAIAKQIPDTQFIVTSPPISFQEYCNGKIPKDYIISGMVGDMQRLKMYGESGFQIHVDIPEDVWNAYEELVKMGYTRKLIKN